MRAAERPDLPVGVRRLARVAEIARHAEVKEAARDRGRYSSDLL
jgi:hypothetical protein